ncbi:dentin sialophosphoprotein-like isoform X3 [Ostrea edulis]|uniref:dentin sialophosphoprotein-like isoform X3 n=1 Tax=Ostrea edulis TaxID=37623 RepID=UPI0024AF89FB|nr:dentin sialophosphoprotein-like isoform X3 [Ostrea edulis]XP_055997372.1 dentin sialophosphoprotein-like isoform X3 [Ostrea edulis]
MATEDRFEVAASDLRGYSVRGFLDKKRPSKKLLSVKYQRRWCVLHDSTLYYFDDPKDRRQKGAFSLIGYRFWHGGSENSFSLVAKGKRTYDFICPTIEDFEKWKAAILAVTENVPSGHEVYINKNSLSKSHSTSSPSTSKKITRKPSFTRESSDDSTDTNDTIPSRPPPVKRFPQRPPAPPMPMSAVNDLDDYDVVDHNHRHSDISSASDDEIYDHAGEPPEPVYSSIRQQSTQSVSSTDSDEDYAHINPRNSDDYASTKEIQLLRKRTSSGYDHPYAVANLKKYDDSQSSDEESYLTSADLHGQNHSSQTPTRKMDSSIASLLGLNIKDKKELNSSDSDLDDYVEFIGEGLAKPPKASSSPRKDRPSRKKCHQEDAILNSVPEDPYMEFVGEEKLYDDEEEDEDEEAVHSEETSVTENDVVQNENTKNNTKQKKALSIQHSLQLELNSKLVQRLNNSEESTPPDPDKGDDEPLYQNFLEINTLETRSLPRDIKMPSSSSSQSHKRKQSSFESNSDSSSEGECLPLPEGVSQSQ